MTIWCPFSPQQISPPGFLEHTSTDAFLYGEVKVNDWSPLIWLALTMVEGGKYDCQETGGGSHILVGTKASLFKCLALVLTVKDSSLKEEGVAIPPLRETK